MTDLIVMLAVLVAAFAIGYFLIRRVPALLHTPLMSMTNAISAVTILGALMVFAVKTDYFDGTMGAVAIVMASFNVVGGFTITHRMLKLFKKSRQSGQ